MNPLQASPRFITFTGADEFTDIDRMVSLSKRYPIEWGILFSPKRQGQGRYPPLAFVQRLIDCGRLRLAAHLCGGHARSALGGIDPLGLGRGSFGRVQINTAEPNIDIAAVRKWAEGLGVRAILQCRGAEFPKTAAVAWLFDQSGGRGIEPGAWPKSHQTSQCGYAGGIGPDNVLDVLSRIDSTDFWIDMESKVRDANDRFDLDAVERVCATVYGQAARATLASPPVEQPSPNLLLEWAVGRWRDEVEHRPLVNKNRRPLDDAWRQVIRYAGGDPEALIGPSHDDLLATTPPAPQPPDSLGRSHDA